MQRTPPAAGILAAVVVGVLVQACIDVSSTPESTAADHPVASTASTQTTEPVPTWRAQT